MQISPIHLLAAGTGLLVLEFLLPGFVALWLGCAALSLGCALQGGADRAADIRIRKAAPERGAGTCQRPEPCFADHEAAGAADRKNQN